MMKIKTLAAFVAAATFGLSAIQVHAQAEGESGLTLDDLDFGGESFDEDTLQMQMADAGKGDNKEFNVVTDEDITSLMKGDVYREQRKLFQGGFDRQEGGGGRLFFGGAHLGES